ncbi:MAG TPA: pseudouridine synthase [Verrucomicrobiae bacterium]|nr:pseudouridine synthase [Verrucomicrobiae bacterium]
MRLQKFLADAGIASRRASEQVILEGRVNVNGHTIREMGSKVDPAHDRVTVDGRAVKVKSKLYLAINKPPGYICSSEDPGNRKTVHDLLPKEWRNLYSVGRLDYKSEGLIFYTNDGEFSLHLTHPRFGVRKKYLVTVKGEVRPEQLRTMEKGIYEGDEVLRAERGRILKSNNSHSMVELTLNEGKNREIRRMFETLGFEVERLQRVQIGPIKLGQLPRGKWRTLTGPEIKSLMRDSREESPEKKRADDSIHRE